MKPTHCNDYLQTTKMGRREFLRAGTLGLYGLTLPQLLQGQAQANTERPARRAKACIILFMWGGPTQQDTWDMKPDAPSEYRGEFRPISTKVPGLQICEHMPRIAQYTDKLAVIRSMTHDDVNHTTATHYLLTGRGVPNRGAPASEDWPNYGAIMSYLGRGREPLPPFVSMMPKMPVTNTSAPRFVEQSHGRAAGWLGPRYNPMRIDENANLPMYRVADFSLQADVPQTRLQRRRTLLSQIENQRRGLESHPEVVGMNTNYTRAFSILNNPQVTRAFDLSREPDRVRDRYGRNIHGQAVLQARRLVEAGVPLVTVFWQNDGIKNVSVYWDTHNRNFIDLKERLCPATDLAFTALLEDLDQRGMLDETLVVWTGEFGRTPRVGQRVVGGAGAGRDGRDHWAHVFTTVLAGGGIRGGVVHGSSDRYAAYPATEPTRPADVAATIYNRLGINHEMQLRDRLNRPLTLCEGTPIQAIME